MSLTENSDGVLKTSEQNAEQRDSTVTSLKPTDFHKTASPRQTKVSLVIDPKINVEEISQGTVESTASDQVTSDLVHTEMRGTDGTTSSYSQSVTASLASEGSKALTAEHGHDRSTVSSIVKKTDAAVSKNPLDDLTNTDLVNTVQELQKNVKYLELENMVFLHYLEKNDPTATEGIDQAIKNVQTMKERASISARKLTLTRASRRESLFLESASFTAPVGGTDKEGPKINITQKTDLVLKEMDDIQESLETLNKKCHKIRHKLKAELEEMSIRETEIKETMQMFEDVFINGIVDKYPQKNPADRFARFMEECFKQSRSIIDKLRLRTSSLKVQYQKICSQLTQKKLLGENLQEVDFEQLQISNKRLVEKIDKRNLLLLELKKMNGHGNLLLSRTKKTLLKKKEDLQDVKDTIKFREDMVVKLDDESEKVANELEQTKEEYDKIKEKSENYRVPPVLDYVRAKAELGILKKNLKVWARRKQIKDMALNASIREMKFTTGLPKAKPSWFVTGENVAGSQDEFEFVFEKLAQSQKKSR